QITEAERLARLDIQTIVLDPGHGGKDPGARGPGGLTEKEVVLDVARRLRDLLQDRLGKKVLMTRDKDAFVELDDRAKFANGHKADLFVSIISTRTRGAPRAGSRCTTSASPRTGARWKWPRGKTATPWTMRGTSWT